MFRDILGEWGRWMLKSGGIRITGDVSVRMAARRSELWWAGTLGRALDAVLGDFGRGMPT